LIGSITTVIIEYIRSRDDRNRRRIEALRLSAAAFTATVAHIELLAAAVIFDNEGRADVLRHLGELQRQARAEYEVVRLLLVRGATQETGLKVLRRAFQLWKEAERNGVHPRSAGSKWVAFQTELWRFRVGVREELGIRNPADVFVEPADWQAWLEG
jgi:hypothetical protein